MNPQLKLIKRHAMGCNNLAYGFTGQTMQKNTILWVKVKLCCLNIWLLNTRGNAGQSWGQSPNLGFMSFGSQTQKNIHGKNK